MQLVRIRSVATLREKLGEATTKKAKEEELKNQVRIRKFVDWDTERVLQSSRNRSRSCRLRWRR